MQMLNIYARNVASPKPIANERGIPPCESALFGAGFVPSLIYIYLRLHHKHYYIQYYAMLWGWARRPISRIFEI